MPLDLEKLTIVHYPDPRLRQKCAPVARFDEGLANLAGRMLELMRAAKGVGLAAPQVGVSLRLFVMNPTGQEGHDLVVINPEFLELAGTIEAEEGCLSIPGVNVQVKRAQRCRLRFFDLTGRTVEAAGQDLVSRIWQHESDHLNGTLILDKMGPTDRIATRKTLHALEEVYEARHGQRAGRARS